ncbi:extracellular solute-binding protein [Rhizohabitans arisaemae]|uniref:extracellular solute-binding protein n=1 Tax=Rhizohabitans arisaemae TaxID=2720610 RepID=UPI0024B05CDA|nr:extracellular solute-binding protein [Rhizohabitans arisaemae]
MSVVRGSRTPAAIAGLVVCLAVSGCGVGPAEASAARGTVFVAGPGDGTPGPPVAPKPTPTTTPTPPAALGPPESTLNIVTFPGYAERGGNDPRVDWVTEFERETECKVGIREVESVEEMGARFDPEAYDYDVALVPPELADELIAARRVEPLNFALIDGYDATIPRLRNLPGIKGYGVPFVWSVNRIAYHTSAVKSAPEDARGLFTADGGVVMRDHPLTIADAALYLRDRRPDLRISDPFQLTPAQLEAAVDTLARQREAVRLYWRRAVEVVEAFVGGEVRVGQMAPYHAQLLARAGQPVKTARKPPATGWVDSWMVAAHTSRRTCAYKWLSWTASPEVQRRAAAWTGTAPANRDACEGLGGELCPDIRSVEFARRPTADCGGTGQGCTTYATWATRWLEIAK